MEYKIYVLKHPNPFVKTRPFSTAVPILMEAFGHQSQKQTLDYLGIQPDEIMDIYLKLEL